MKTHLLILASNHGPETDILTDTIPRLIRIDLLLNHGLHLPPLRPPLHHRLLLRLRPRFALHNTDLPLAVLARGDGTRRWRTPPRTGARRQHRGCLPSSGQADVTGAPQVAW